jgi:hypothetical protein
MASDGVRIASNQNKRKAAITRLAAMEKREGGYVNPASSAGVSPTWGEAWRHECEIRFALSLPDKSDHRRKGFAGISKREYLNGVLAKRGQAAHDRLRDDMKARWKARK